MKEIVVYGYHSIEELLLKGGLKGTLYLQASKKKLKVLQELARKQDLPVVLTDENELSRITGSREHRGAILILTEIPLNYSSDFKLFISNLRTEISLVLLLDEITDPHNFGAILRSADQFAVDCVVVTERRSAAHTQTVLAASAGSSSYVKIFTVSNLRNAIALLKEKGFWVYGAEVTGQSLAEVKFAGKVALVLGREGQGLHRLVSQHCDQLVRIPTQGHIDSFNVSVAAGILMYEIRRQQKWL